MYEHLFFALTSDVAMATSAKSKGSGVVVELSAT